MQHTKEAALEILKSMGEECFDKQDYIRSIVYYNKYLEIDPNNADIYNTIGYIYRIIGGVYENIDLQIESFEKALKLDANNPFVLRNLAIVYPLVDRYHEAIECFQKLFEIDAIMDDYLTYAYLQIKLGNFDEGWKYFESRFARQYMPTEYPKIVKPRWKGQDISDKTILIQCEQGFGDSIQFCRYIERVKPFVKKIIFRVQDSLADLMKINLEKDKKVKVVGMTTALEEILFDYHIPLLSLMHVLKERIDTIPMPQGYIKADESLLKRYKKGNFDAGCFKIGISWNGAKYGNVYRNIPLECFYPLTKLKNVKVYSFQKGYGTEQLDKLPRNIEIVDIGKTFNDFSDTAAAMANMDLFITSDNSLLNLAGAMAKKTFLLLNKYSEWRWFLDEKITPWYDSVTLFKKQNESDNWDLLMQKVVKNIKFEYKI